MQITPSSNPENFLFFPSQKSLFREIQHVDKLAVPYRVKAPSFTSVSNVKKSSTANVKIDDPRHLKQVFDELKISREESLQEIILPLDSEKPWSQMLHNLEKELVDNPQPFLDTTIHTHQTYFARVEELAKTGVTIGQNEDFIILFKFLKNAEIPPKIYYQQIFDKILEMGGPLALLENNNLSYNLNAINDPYLIEGIKIVLREFLFNSLMSTMLERGPSQETAQQIVNLYQKTAEHGLVWTGRIIPLNEFHKKLNQTFPQLEPFFHPVLQPIISIKGISLIMDELTKKDLYKEEYLTCDGEIAFSETIEHLKNFKGAIFLKITNGAHITPMYLETEANRTKVFIADSLGYGNKKNLAQIVKILRISWPESKIYCLSPQRQFDNLSCPAFAIRDIVAMARNHDLWKFAEENSQYDPEMLTHKLAKTPLALEKMSQSITLLQSSDIGSDFFKKHAITILDSSGKPKEQSNYALKRRAKYTALIIVKVLEAGLKIQ